MSANDLTAGYGWVSRGKPGFWLQRSVYGPFTGQILARGLLWIALVANPILIETRHLSAMGREVPVQLFRNACGSVSARCVIDVGDTPIVDGPTADAVIQILQESLEALLLTRMRKSA